MTNYRFFPEIHARNLPKSREEFYDKRDDRTLRVTDTTDYRNAPVLVTGDMGRLSTFAGQVTLLTAVNTISRFSRDIDVIIPEFDLAPEIQSQTNRLTEQCRREMQAADPYGDFNVTTDDTDWSYDAALVLGDRAADIEHTVRIDASGWLARVATNRPIEPFTSSEPNPVGPGVAASYGAAEIFKGITGDSAPSADAFTFDAYHLAYHSGFEPIDRRPSIPDRIDLSDVHMIGAGAVGSATLYFTRHLPLSMRLTVIDADQVDYTNLNRSPLFTAHDAVHETSKVKVAERFLPDTIPTAMHDQWYDEYLDEHGRGTPDVVLPLADERNVRASIQHNYPPIMLHTTTGGWSVNVRRTIPIKEPCLLCHFPPGQFEQTNECGTGHIYRGRDDEEGQIQGALPFTTPMAGALLTGELIKLNQDHYPITKNNVLVALESPGSLQSNWNHEPDCGFCSELDEELYRSLLQGTKFANLGDSNSAAIEVDD